MTLGSTCSLAGTACLRRTGGTPKYQTHPVPAASSPLYQFFMWKLPTGPACAVDKVVSDIGLAGRKH